MTFERHVNVGQLAERWWMLLTRGIVAILFGLVIAVAPRISLLVLVTVFGIYAVIDGVINVMMAFRSTNAGRNWGWLGFEGIVSVAAGAFAFVSPGITAWVLLMVIASRAVLAGVAEIVAAIRLRKQVHGEWLLALSGGLSIAFGSMLFLFPGRGALALLWMIGAYAIVFGALVSGLGLRLERWRRTPARPIPHAPGATPA